MQKTNKKKTLKKITGSKIVLHAKKNSPQTTIVHANSLNKIRHFVKAVTKQEKENYYCWIPSNNEIPDPES